MTTMAEKGNSSLENNPRNSLSSSKREIQLARAIVFTREKKKDLKKNNTP